MELLLILQGKCCIPVCCSFGILEYIVGYYVRCSLTVGKYVYLDSCRVNETTAMVICFVIMVCAEIMYVFLYVITCIVNLMSGKC